MDESEFSDVQTIRILIDIIILIKIRILADFVINIVSTRISVISTKISNFNQKILIVYFQPEIFFSFFQLFAKRNIYCT